MKNLKNLQLIAVLVALLLTSCTSTTIVKNTPAKTAPPGQVKKTTGSQSAKSYAPGQQKKKETKH